MAERTHASQPKCETIEAPFVVFNKAAHASNALPLCILLADEAPTFDKNQDSYQSLNLIKASTLPGEKVEPARQLKNITDWNKEVNTYSSFLISPNGEALLPTKMLETILKELERKSKSELKIVGNTQFLCLEVLHIALDNT